ncbi:hypothetical protein V8E53_003214 [Lactarius tabidus]
MAPRMRGQHTTANTGAVDTPADASKHSKSKKKKGKEVKMHCDLPMLTIRKPCTEVAVSEVIGRKHPLSPEEGPAAANRVKACPVHTPRLELLTDEEEIMNHEVPTLMQSLTSREVHAQLMLIAKWNYIYLAETLIMEDDSSSLDNNCSHSSLSRRDSSSECPPEDEECDWDVPAALPPQTARLSQKMAFERASWPASTSECIVQVDAPHSTAPSNQEAYPTGAPSEHQQGKHLHSKYPQVSPPDSRGKAPLSRTDVQPTQILSVLKFLHWDPQAATSDISTTSCPQGNDVA